MKSKKGFTLIELVVVITIVIILSVVAVPIYRSYVNKAVMTEGYALLGTILTAQKSYYVEYGYFWGNNGWTNTKYNPALGINAESNKYFTNFGIYTTDEGFVGKVYIPGAYQTDNKNELIMYYNTVGGATIREEIVEYEEI